MCVVPFMCSVYGIFGEFEVHIFLFQLCDDLPDEHRFDTLVLVSLKTLNILKH